MIVGSSFFVTRMDKNMKEDKNRDAVDTELKELEDDQEVTKFAKKFIAELLFWPRKKAPNRELFR